MLLVAQTSADMSAINSALAACAINPNPCAALKTPNAALSICRMAWADGDRIEPLEAFMPYLDDIRRGRLTSAVAWTIFLVAFAAVAVVVWLIG